jgi:citrate synthase
MDVQTVPVGHTGAEHPGRGREPASVRDVIARQLDLDPIEITPNLTLHDVPEWSSLAHVELLLALEEHLGRPIDGPLGARLTSVAAIEDFALTGSLDDPTPDRKPTGTAAQPADEATAHGPVIHRGLAGVHVDTSAITSIDGDRGELLIRGYPIEDLAAHASYPEVCHLVLHGEPPDQHQLNALVDRLCQPPRRPRPIDGPSAQRWAELHPMVALRTEVSRLGHSGTGTSPSTPGQVIEIGLDLLAHSQRTLADHHRAGLEPMDTPPDQMIDLERPVDPRFAPAHIFLYRFFGTEPDPIEAEALDLVWRLAVDHGSNASTFAARVAAAAGSDVVGAVVSGLATFAGELHGGATEGVTAGLADISRPERAERWVADRRAQGLAVMGYGHRVYRVADPRSAPLQAMASRLADHRGDRRLIEVTEALQEAMARYSDVGLSMNVDSYSSVLYALLGFPARYHTALFAIARMAGWVAHVAEQVERNVLIRPRLAYTGPARRPWATQR